MYHSKSEYGIPESMSVIPDDFLQNLIFSYSPEHSQYNNQYKERIMSNPNTIIYLIEMIKQTICVPNQKYIKEIRMIFSFLLKIIELNSSSIQQNENLMQCILSSIDFLLPFTAQIFQQINDIYFFDCLLSCMFQLARNNQQILAFFSNYIVELLSNQQAINIHKIIISYRLFNYSIGSSKEENDQVLTISVYNVLKYLPKCEECSNIEVDLYEMMFYRFPTFISSKIIQNIIPINEFETIIVNYIQNFIINCQKSLENNVKLLNSVLYFLSYLNETISLNRKPEFIQFSQKICDLIYHQGCYLNQVSLFHCSQTLIEFVQKNFNFFTINFRNQSELNYFVNYIFCFSSLNDRDMEECLYNQENFFYDNYEIFANEYQFFSARQVVVRIFLELFQDGKAKPLSFLLLQIAQTDPNNFGEVHMFILSQINRIIYNKIEYDDNDIELSEKNIIKCREVMKKIFYKFIPFLSAKAKATMQSPNWLSSAISVSSVFSYLFLITTSFDLLNDQNIRIFNDEVRIIYQVLCNSNNYKNFNSLLFTYLCMLSSKLLERNQLLNSEQLYMLIESNVSYCLTEHAYDFINIFAIKNKNSKCLVLLFNYFLNQCESFFLDILSKQTNEFDPNELILIDDEIIMSKSFIYQKNHVQDKIQKMASIMDLLEEFIFDEEKLLRLVQFLVYFDEDWLFEEECLCIMAKILEKSPNPKKWAAAYFEFVKNSEKIKLFGEWICPFLNLISLRCDSIDQEFGNFFIEKLMFLCKENIIFSYGAEECGFVFELVTILFELAFLKKIYISPEILNLFCNLAEQIKSHYDDKDLSVNESMVKISAILAGLNIAPDIFAQFFSKIVNDNLIITNEIRYLVIILIDNFISEKDRPNFAQLREICLTRPKSKNDDRLSNIIHPIVKFYPMPGFVYAD